MNRLEKLAFPVFLVALSLLALPGGALAGTPNVESGVRDVVSTDAPKPPADKPEGWTVKVSPNTSLTFNDNRHVVGAPDGYTFTWTGKFELAFSLWTKHHEWRNNLLMLESVSKTPVLDKFFLSADQLHFESIYLYHIVDWVGVYGRFILDTSMFPGYDYQPKPVTYAIKDKGRVTEIPVKRDKLRTHDPFAPLHLKQGVGPFFRPLAKETVNLEILFGFGFRESLVDKTLSKDDDGGTPAIEYKLLHNFYNVGGESTVRLWGDLWQKKIGYQVGAEMLMPFYSKPKDSTLKAADRLYVALGTRWSFRLFSWMSLDYELKAIRDKPMSREWQIQNNILFNLGYAFEKFFKKG